MHSEVDPWELELFTRELLAEEESSVNTLDPTLSEASCAPPPDQESVQSDDPASPTTPTSPTTPSPPMDKPEVVKEVGFFESMDIRVRGRKTTKENYFRKQK